MQQSAHVRDQPESFFIPCTSLVSRLRPKRRHQKSRLGCQACKKRRVKCDEARPVCTSCVNFHLPCLYEPGGEARLGLVSQQLGQVEIQHGVDGDGNKCAVKAQRRKRGRPRNHYAVHISPQSGLEAPGPPAFPNLFSHTSRGSSADSPSGKTPHVPAELLFHFITYTGPSLVGTKDPKHPTVLFWQRDAVQVALEYPFVLHMILSLAMFHAKYLHGGHNSQVQADYTRAALQQLLWGISSINAALHTLNDANCGALLVASMLLCSCTFAAGPKSRQDILLGQVGDQNADGILCLIKGSSLLRDRVDSHQLYVGTLKRLAPEVASSQSEARPTYTFMNIPWVDWTEHLRKLEHAILSEQSVNMPTYLRAYDTICNIYEATYGNKDGKVTTPSHFQISLILLYATDDPFMTCVLRGEPLALLLFAYYAPLLRTDTNAWYLHGWADNIVYAINDILGHDYADLMKWPKELISASLSR